MTNNIFWVLEMNINSGKMELVRSLMTEMIEATFEQEPGAINYEWFIDEDTGSCHIYERYSDSDAVMVHLENFGEKFAERFLEYMTPGRFAVYGKPSEQVVEALNGFGAAYYSDYSGFAR